ncbi:glycosyltransferase family 4 protein [Candidatus Uhrbacteria bacterium]|nr:glycosyltransferase family 4 protein [Candidatus Uhrbacteria bacterium]
MNHLIISPNSPFVSIGGIERYIKNLIDFCQDQPGNYYFILPSKTKEEIVQIGNVSIHFKSFLNLSYKKRKSIDVKKGSQKQVKDKSIEFFEFLNTFIPEHAISAVTAQNFHLGLPPSYSLMVNMVCHTKQVPLFLQLHSFSTNPLQTEIINGLFWKKVLCVSKSVAGDCFQKGLAISHITTKYLGVNIKEFTPQTNRKWLKKHLGLSSSDKVIVSASRILQGYSDILTEKGLINLLDAFSKIRSTRSDVYLLIAVGKPPQRLNQEFEAALQKLEGYTQIHGIEDFVIIKTFPMEKMPEVYAGSDVFALPSENETFGQVFIEAMACGLPVIGTNVGGIPEIITDKHNGFLVQANDASELAHKISTILENDKIRKTFVKNGLKTVALSFDTQKLFPTLFNYLEKHSH